MFYKHVNDSRSVFLDWLNVNNMHITFRTSLTITSDGVFKGGLHASVVWRGDTTSDVEFGKDSVLVSVSGYSDYVGMSPEKAVSNLFDRILEMGANMAVYYDAKGVRHEVLPPRKNDYKYLYRGKTVAGEEINVCAYNETIAREIMQSLMHSKYWEAPDYDERVNIQSILNLGPAATFKKE